MPHTNFHLDLKMAFDTVKDVGGGGKKGERKKRKIESVSEGEYGIHLTLAVVERGLFAYRDFAAAGFEPGCTTLLSDVFIARDANGI